MGVCYLNDSNKNGKNRWLCKWTLTAGEQTISVICRKAYIKLETLKR